MLSHDERIKSEALEQLQAFVKAVRTIDDKQMDASSLQSLVASAEDLLIRAKYKTDNNANSLVIYLVKTPMSVEVVTQCNQLIAFANPNNEEEVARVGRMYDDLIRTGLFSSVSSEDCTTPDLLAEGFNSPSGHQLELKES